MLKVVSRMFRETEQDAQDFNDLVSVIESAGYMVAYSSPESISIIIDKEEIADA